MSNSNTLTLSGRLMWGDIQHPSPVLDFHTKQPKFNKEGQPRTAYTFGLGLDQAGMQAYWAAMSAVAAQAFPNGVPRDFATKLKTPADNAGKDPAYNDRFVVACSTELPRVPVYNFDNGAYFERPTDQTIKHGDYITVRIDLAVNTGSNPSIYVNPTMVRFDGAGDPIYNGLTPQEAFGSAPASVPPQAPSAPMGNGAVVPGASAQMPQPGGAAPAAPTMPGLPATGTASPTSPRAPQAPGYDMTGVQPGAIPGMPGMPGT